MHGIRLEFGRFLQKCVTNEYTSNKHFIGFSLLQGGGGDNNNTIM